MSKKYTGLVLIVIALIIAITSIILFSGKDDIQRGSLNLTSGTQEELNSRADETGFIVMVNTNIVVNNDRANLLIENPEENGNKCQVDVYDESDRLIYQSDIIPPGYYIEEVKLFESMDAGEHTGKAVFNILNDNNEVKSTASVKLKITVH